MKPWAGDTLSVDGRQSPRWQALSAFRWRRSGAPGSPLLRPAGEGHSRATAPTMQPLESEVGPRGVRARDHHWARRLSGPSPSGCPSVRGPQSPTNAGRPARCRSQVRIIAVTHQPIESGGGLGVPELGTQGLHRGCRYGGTPVPNRGDKPGKRRKQYDKGDYRGRKKDDARRQGRTRTSYARLLKETREEASEGVGPPETEGVFKPVVSAWPAAWEVLAQGCFQR